VRSHTSSTETGCRSSHEAKLGDFSSSSACKGVHNCGYDLPLAPVRIVLTRADTRVRVLAGTRREWTPRF
jgi:hypothetical protein